MNTKKNIKTWYEYLIFYENQSKDLIFKITDYLNLS